jgi:hypothetical protein
VLGKNLELEDRQTDCGSQCEGRNRKTGLTQEARCTEADHPASCCDENQKPGSCNSTHSCVQRKDLLSKQGSPWGWWRLGVLHSPS